MLLRGAQLRNTQWVVGIVVYTGHDSKLMQVKLIMLSTNTTFECPPLPRVLHSLTVFPELHQGAAEALKRGAGDQHADLGSVWHPAGDGVDQLCGCRHLEQRTH